jgi:hypothetical protein
MSEKKLSQIFIYPIKSLGGIAVDSTVLTAKGPKWDRRWMLVDESGRFLSQRELGEMTLLHPHLEKDHLRVADSRGRRADLEIPLAPSVGPAVTVTIWNDNCTAVPVSADADRWFSEALQHPCQLVYMPDTTFRPVDPAYAQGEESVSFADGYPYLIIGEASLADLNRRLEEPVEMLRFRPNLVFSGGKAFEEDHWQNFTIGRARFRGAKPCARCQIPTIDLHTGLSSKEPTRTLATFRRDGNKVLFGMNVCWSLEHAAADSQVRVGDAIQIS